MNALRLAGTYDIIYLTERFVFEFGIFLLSYCGQIFSMFGLPGGNYMFEKINKPMVIISGLMYGLYATSYGIFINIVLNLKTQGIIINIGIYIIQLIFSAMFKYGYMYDYSILPKPILNLYRLLMPFNYGNYVLGAILLRSKAYNGRNYETMSQIVWQVPCTWE